MVHVMSGFASARISGARSLKIEDLMDDIAVVSLPLVLYSFSVSQQRWFIPTWGGGCYFA